jgi:hypothetical protein
MTVAELRKALEKLDQDLYVCGIAADESLCLASGVADVKVADEWHDSLPRGERYVYLRFGESLKRPPQLRQRCPECGWEKVAEERTHCRRCSWKPMLTVLGEVVPKGGQHARVDTEGR